MDIIFTFSNLSKLLAVIGLLLDVIGVFKLFSVEPIQLEPICTNIFNATLGEYTKVEKLDYVTDSLNNQIESVNRKNKSNSRKGKKYKSLIFWGFILQTIAVLLSFF